MNPYSLKDRLESLGKILPTAKEAYEYILQLEKEIEEYTDNNHHAAIERDLND